MDGPFDDIDWERVIMTKSDEWMAQQKRPLASLEERVEAARRELRSLLNPYRQLDWCEAQVRLRVAELDRAEAELKASKEPE